MSKVEDSSGFEVKFEDDTPEVERKFYQKSFPLVDSVSDRRIHCTTCNIHIGTAPVVEPKIRMHPVLRVTICRSCFTFYNSGEFEKGEDGSELYCRWCGQGGEVYCCSNCPYVFCKKCIIQNLSRATVQDIERTDNWACFSCSPQILFHLRAQHWALTNFVEKQLKQIDSSNLTREEISERMNKDSTTCCAHRRKTIEKKAPVQTIKPKPPQVQMAKKRSGSPGFSAPGSASKKQCNVLPASAILNGQVPKAASGSDRELVCTPDISLMFNMDDNNAGSASAPTRRPPPAVITASTQQIRNVPPLSVRQYVGATGSTAAGPGTGGPQPRGTSIIRSPSGMPMVLNQQSVMQQIRPNPPTPVYHTINGYRIDLNTAAQQDTFRLPNGKLIQVKKQVPTPGGGQAPAPTPSIRMPAQIQQRPSGPVMSVRYPTPPGASHIINGIRQPVHLMNQPNQIRPTGLPLKPPPTVLQKPNHPPTPLGNARNAFEMKVYGSLEVCHQIIAKINILSNNSSYKNVRHLKDLKELYIHLSYLLTYAQGRFKGLQDKCAEELKSLGFEDAKEDAKDGDGDVEVIDNPAPLIEIDSDDDTPAPAAPAPKSSSTAAAAPEKPRKCGPASKTNAPASARGPSAPSTSETIDESSDPKLMQRPRIVVQRVETIRPEIIEALKKIKDEKKDPVPSTSKEIVVEKVVEALKNVEKAIAEKEKDGTVPEEGSTEKESSKPEKVNEKEADVDTTAEAAQTTEKPEEEKVPDEPAPETDKETTADSSTKDGSTNEKAPEIPTQDNQVSSAAAAAIVIDDDEVIPIDDGEKTPTEEATPVETNKVDEIVALDSSDDDIDEVTEVTTKTPEKVVEGEKSAEKEEGECEKPAEVEETKENETEKEVEGEKDSELKEKEVEPSNETEKVEKVDELKINDGENAQNEVETNKDEAPVEIEKSDAEKEAIIEDEKETPDAPEASETSNSSSNPIEVTDSINESKTEEIEPKLDEKESEIKENMETEEQKENSPEVEEKNESSTIDSELIQDGSEEEPTPPVTPPQPPASESLEEDKPEPESSSSELQNDEVEAMDTSEVPTPESSQEPLPLAASTTAEPMEVESSLNDLIQAEESNSPAFNPELEPATSSTNDLFDVPTPSSSSPKNVLGVAAASAAPESNQITLEDVDVDLFQTASDDPQKSELNIDDLIAESDLTALTENFDQDAWNI